MFFFEALSKNHPVSIDCDGLTPYVKYIVVISRHVRTVGCASDIALHQVEHILEYILYIHIGT